MTDTLKLDENELKALAKEKKIERYWVKGNDTLIEELSGMDITVELVENKGQEQAGKEPVILTEPKAEELKADRAKPVVLSGELHKTGERVLLHKRCSNGAMYREWVPVENVQERLNFGWFQ